MQFNVSTLLQEPTGSTREYDIDDDIMIEGVRRHVAGHVRFDRTPRGVLVRAKVRGRMDGECSRCLKPLSYDVDVAFDEVYLPTIDVNTGLRVPLEDGDDEAYRIDERHTLDLSEPVRQYWSIGLPMAPLCAEDCAGLCPVCGEELSRDGHACTREQIDNRWLKLADLKLG